MNSWQWFKPHRYMCFVLCVSLYVCNVHVYMYTRVHLQLACTNSWQWPTLQSQLVCMCLIVCVSLCVFNVHVYVYTCVNLQCVHKLMATANDAKPIGICVFLCLFVCVRLCVSTYMCMCTHMNTNNVCARTYGNGQQCKAHSHLCVCLCVLFCVCWSSCVSCTCVCVPTCTFTTYVHELMATIQSPEVCVCLVCVC